MKLKFFTAILIAFIHASLALGEEKEWNLDALIDQALEKREDVAAQNEKILRAQAKVNEAFSHYFPRVRLASAYTKTQSEYELDLSEYTVNTSTTVNTFLGPMEGEVNVTLPENIILMKDEYGSVSVTMDQPIFTWGRISHYLDAAKKLKEYEISAKKGTEAEAVCQVRKAYHSYLVAREAQKFFRRSHQELSVIARLMKKSMKGGDATGRNAPSRLDYMELEGLLLNAQSMMIESESMVKQALSYLSFSAGFQDVLKNESVTGDLDTNFEFHTKQEYIDKGLKQNARLESIDIGVQAQNHLYKAEKASRMPALNLRLFYERLGNNDIIQPDEYYGARIVLEGPIFDSGEIRARASQHLYRKKELMARRKFLENHVRTTISSLYDEIMGLKEQARIDSEAMGLMDQRLKLALFGLKNRLTTYRSFKEAYLMRNVLKKEQFIRLRAYFDKINRLVKLIGERKI